MIKISVAIICYNEEDKIRDCLESVNWVDEIVVVDSGSTDNTIEVVKKYTDNILLKKWEGFSVQKEFAVSQTKNNWVLSLDADERVSQELKNEIISLEPSDYSGFFIKRRNFFLNKHITSCGWNDDKQLRLFNKQYARMVHRSVHEGFVVEGSVKTLTGDLIHLTYDSIEIALKKINNYTSLQADEIDSFKKANIFSIILRSISQFLRFFISLKGYKDGFHGFLLAFFNSITSFLIYTKLWERKVNK